MTAQFATQDTPAGPFTAAITGFLQLKIASTTRPPVSTTPAL